MAKRPSKTRDPEAIRQDFFDAIERILSGKPRHPELKERAAKGKLKLDILAVAREANRSRTLIARSECQYPEVRAMILAHQAAAHRPEIRTAQDVISSLRQQLAEKSREAKGYQDHALARFTAQREAEERLANADTEVRRLNKIIGNLRAEVSGANITPLRS